MIYTLINFTVKETAVTEVIGLIEEFMAGVADKEPDVLRYESFQAVDKVHFTHLVHFYDEKAKQGHEKADHTVALYERLNPLCEQEPTFTELNLITSNE